MVERMPKAQTVSVQLFVSSRTAPETVKTNGLRHLLEHFLALGTKGDLDMRLESAGGYLTAQTMRDATQFAVNVPSEKLSLGISALEETMHMPVLTPAQIKQEANVIRQEAALRDPEELLSASAWQTAYGDRGLDAFGNPDVMASATPSDLTNLHRAMYIGSNLVISIAGNVDLDEATRRASELLAAIPRGDSPKETVRGPANSGTAEIDVKGQARAAAVPSFRSPRASWCLAAGLAVAAKVPHSFVTYTPTTRSGLIIVGQTDGADIGKTFDQAHAEELLHYGRTLAKSWVTSQLHDPVSLAFLRGLLLVQSQGLKPETLLENLDSMQLDQFRDGLDAFRTHAVAVGGMR